MSLTAESLHLVRLRAKSMFIKLDRTRDAFLRPGPRGPQRPAPFELVFELRNDGGIYIRPRGRL